MCQVTCSLLTLGKVTFSLLDLRIESLLHSVITRVDTSAFDY